MGNDVFPSTYKKRFELCIENMILSGGLCLSSAPIESLHSESDLFLHPKEKAYLNNLEYPKRQKSFLLGRYCAKQALSSYTNHEALNTTFIENGIFNQPVMNHPHFPNIQVSISHTDQLGAAIAFPETHPMAIDIETICISKIATMKTQLMDKEQQFTGSFSGTAVELITLLWTAKEALSKVLKCGCMIAFELLEVETLLNFDDFTLSSFKNLYQYQALSFPVNNAYCSIVYPKKTKLKLDLPDRSFI